MRGLLDTNIVLDFVLKRQPFHAEAKEIFVCAAQKKIEIFVSPITPINVFYTTRREKIKEIAFQSIEKLLKIIKITESNQSVFQNALLLNFTDYEDAVQHECAVAENLDAIVTRNTKDSKDASLTIYSPGDFLKQL